MKTKVTKHGKTRLKERLNIFNAYATAMKTSKVNGKKIYHYEGKFFYYLNSKINGKIYVYRDNIYLFGKSRKNKKLITVFPVPLKYLPTSQYEIDETILKKVMDINSLSDSVVEITLRNGMNIYGEVIFDRNKPRNAIRLKLRNKRVLIIKGKDIVDYRQKKGNSM